MYGGMEAKKKFNKFHSIFLSCFPTLFPPFFFTFFGTKSTTYQYHYHLFFSISLEKSIWIMYQILDMLEACLVSNLSFKYSWLWPVDSPFEITLYRSVMSSQHFNWQKQTKMKNGLKLSLEQGQVLDFLQIFISPIMMKIKV